MPTDVKVLWGPASLAPWSRGGWDIDYDLDDSDDKVAVTFIVEKDGTIDRIGFNIAVFNGSPPDYQVSLETVDDNDCPTGTDFGGSAPGTFSPTGTGWLWVSLGTPATVAVGDRVAAVIGPTASVPSAANSIDIISAGVGAPNFYLPEVKYFTTSWITRHEIPPIAVRYTDDDVSGLAAESLLGETFTSAEGPDEMGCKFTLPADMICYGVRAGFQSCVGSYDMKLYSDTDVLLASISVELDKSSNLTQDFFWDAVSLPAGTYRLTVCSTSSTFSVTPARITFPDTDSRDWIPEGTRWSGTERAGAGAWTDEALEVGYMALWINSITL